MANWDFKHLFVAFILFASVGSLMLMAVQYQAASYGKDTTGILAGPLKISSFNNSISGLEASSQNMRSQFEKQNPFSALAGIIITGFFDIMKTITSLILSPFALIGNLLYSLGVPSFLISVILGLLIIAILFGIWEVVNSANA